VGRERRGTTADFIAERLWRFSPFFCSGLRVNISMRGVSLPDHGKADDAESGGQLEEALNHAW